jgi:uncharacterized protein
MPTPTAPTPQNEPLKDLRQLKRRAKELLRAYREGETDAVSLVDAHFDAADRTTFRLAQAQLVLARHLGFSSWARLRDAAGATAEPRHPRTKPAEMRGRYVYDVDAVDGDQAWALFQACRDGNTSAVRALLEADPNLVHAQYWYTQPIHFAVYANQPEVLRVLLDAGTEPGRTRFMDSGWNKLLEYSETMGFEAVHGTLVECARTRFGYDPDFTQLRDAIVSRERERIGAVLGQRDDLARACDAQGNNVFHWAVMTRQPELFARFRQLGADPNHRRSDGQTPAHLLFNGDYAFRTWRELQAVRHADQTTTLHALLDAGATADLSVACARGDIDRVNDLLTANPESARLLDSGRRSPLMYAARAGHLDIVRTLLHHGAHPNQPEELASQGHALWMACATGRADIVKLLLDHGANPNATPDSSDSCLGITRSRAGDAAGEIERLLRARGATIPMWHMSNDDLRRALTSGAPVTGEFWFAEEVLARNDLALTELLLDHDPDVVNRLHGGTLRLGSSDVAITENAVLRRLLDAGFDPNRAGWLGKTALHHYAGRGETGNALLVIEYGADIDAVDDEFHGTPLAWAAAAGHEGTVRMLLEHGANPSIPATLPRATPAARARVAGHDAVARLVEAALGGAFGGPP